ncbi:hypothetical protein ACFSTC_38405 [Nonomuraea ferruginea]
MLLVPLGDLFDRRRLITVHLLLTAAGAGVASAAPSGGIAIAGLALAGLFAVVVQITVAYVATVSPAERARPQHRSGHLGRGHRDTRSTGGRGHTGRADRLAHGLPRHRRALRDARARRPIHP